MHVTSDNVIVLAHDPSLDRTTNGHGLIAETPYHNGIDQLQTLKKPSQPVPTFAHLIQLLCQPENAHVLFNIDCKVIGVAPLGPSIKCSLKGVRTGRERSRRALHPHAPYHCRPA